MSPDLAPAGTCLALVFLCTRAFGPAASYPKNSSSHFLPLPQFTHLHLRHVFPSVRTETASSTCAEAQFLSRPLDQEELNTWQTGVKPCVHLVALLYRLRSKREFLGRIELNSRIMFAELLLIFICVCVCVVLCCVIAATETRH